MPIRSPSMGHLEQAAQRPPPDGPLSRTPPVLPEPVLRISEVWSGAHRQNLRPLPPVRPIRFRAGQHPTLKFSPALQWLGVIRRAQSLNRVGRISSTAASAAQEYG